MPSTACPVPQRAALSSKWLWSCWDLWPGSEGKGGLSTATLPSTAWGGGDAVSKDSTELGKPNTEGRCQARLPSRRVFGWREERGAASATPLAQLGPFLPLRLSAQVPAAAGRSPWGVRSPSWGASLPWPRGQGCLVLVLNGLGARRAMVLSFLGGLWDGDGDGMEGWGAGVKAAFPMRCSAGVGC